MAIDYLLAPDVEELVREVISTLNLKHIDPGRVKCFRSRGSKARHTIARIHALPRIWQRALEIHPHYTIEVISERYDPLPPAEKERTMIHELLHIPAGFKGGFRHHRGYVTRRRVEDYHRAFTARRGEPSHS